MGGIRRDKYEEHIIFGRSGDLFHSTMLTTIEERGRSTNLIHLLRYTTEPFLYFQRYLMSFASKFTSVIMSKNVGIVGTLLSSNSYWCPSSSTPSSNPSVSARSVQIHVEFRITKNHAVVSELITKLLAEHARIDQGNITVDFVDDFRKSW